MGKIKVYIETEYGVIADELTYPTPDGKSLAYAAEALAYAYAGVKSIRDVDGGVLWSPAHAK